MGTSGVGKMAQWVGVHVTKNGSLSLMPGTHVTEGVTTRLQVSSDLRFAL